MSLTISYSESAFPITPVELLKPRFWDNFEICLLFVVNNNTYLPISVPDYPSRTVESISLLLYSNFCIQWSLPKRTLREAGNPLQRTNLVARIEFAMHIIIT